MHPEETHLFIYAMFSAIGLLVGIVLMRLLNVNRVKSNKISTILPVIIIGAIIGAKIPVIISYGWHKEFIWTGKSYFGALIGAFLSLNIYKRIIGESSVFGDRFVIPLCVSSGIGKIGCYQNGCCGGIETNSFLGFHNIQNIAVFPVQLYESAFQFFCAIFFFILFKKKLLTGAHFQLYMIFYMSFRFSVEFIRIEPKYLFNISVYQWMSILFLPLFLILFMQRVKNVK